MKTLRTSRVLVVHGIGKQDRYETVGKLLAGLRRVDETSVPDQIDDGVLTTIGGRRVRFYEVYWAELLKGEKSFGLFQTKDVGTLAWFPWLNYWRGNYGPGHYWVFKIVAWSLILPILNLFALLAYRGVTLLSPRGERRFDADEETSASVVLRKTFASGGRCNKIDERLDEYAGDVFGYLNSAGEAFHAETRWPPPDIRAVYGPIVQVFYDQLVKAAESAVTVHIVAHSLGTVITYHALSGLRFEPEGRTDAGAIQAAIAKVSHLYTIGSPLEKVRFFWPKLFHDGPSLAKGRLQWENFVSWFDPVAGTLHRFGRWGEVRNRRLLGGGFIRGHVVYQHSEAFLETFTKGICDRALPIKRTPKERVKDVSLLIGETLLAPGLLIGVLALGAISFAITVGVVPFGMSKVFGWLMPQVAWQRWVDPMSFFIAGALIVWTVITSATLARRVHARYWTFR